MDQACEHDQDKDGRGQTRNLQKKAADLPEEAAAVMERKGQARPMMLAVAISSSSKASDTLPETP
jgi:hypothetical protein